ncbi:MAG: hypothetical protein P0Y49_09385 [Candidatus Pedobacter colombiensis]|uniref:Uncharacterized protein n=1 Tax=Candidatus Pedobacter colombiensis TaxID=3121371 RepID=A0AAJ5W9P2_9SPHI|nr:hypothetical protein [Pedobacter sp.]WEK21353.1 MAG: hypothetical protein P0Y49_09385 [Pedobacter sp.]
MKELLTNITWPQYLLAMVVLAAIYYTVVFLLYFRKDLSKKIKSARQGNEEYPEEELENNAQDAPEDSQGELMDHLESTVYDIEHSILEPGKKATKQELLEQLQTRVASFGGLSRPGYRYALNNFIIEKAKENCGADFSEEELEAAWDNLPR